VYNAHLVAFGRLGRVKAGTVIGFVGNTGDAAGEPTHDHFEWHPKTMPSGLWRSPYGQTELNGANRPLPVPPRGLSSCISGTCSPGPRSIPGLDDGIEIRFHFLRVRRLARARLATGVLAMAAILAACSGSSAATSGRVSVVAAENFYGDIARQLGGRFVSVTSILSDPAADPHLFEPGTAAAAAVADARLVIDNGLGYDAFMDRLLSAAPNADRRVVTIADVLRISGPDANPHIWYDVPRIPEMAKAIADALIAASPAHGSYFRDRLERFDGSLEPLQAAVAELKAKASGAPVAYTEPVPGYLLQAAGLAVRTPDDFARAIEDGNDPSPQAVAAMEGLFTNRDVRVLLYNSQATSPITDRIRQLAEENGIPVVPDTETLPEGMSFQDWQLGQVRALAEALAA
jgi:zinc/manganese transport system substrate-binding protein